MRRGRWRGLRSKAEQLPIVLARERRVQDRPKLLLVELPALDLGQDHRPDQDLASGLVATCLAGGEVADPVLEPALADLELLELEAFGFDPKLPLRYGALGAGVAVGEGVAIGLAPCASARSYRPSWRRADRSPAGAGHRRRRAAGRHFWRAAPG